MSDEPEFINLIDLLERLEEVDAPEKIAMVPQTTGWIWLAVILLAAVVIGVWNWRKWRAANAYRRAALGALEQAANDPVAIANVLRRTALAAFPRERVASLYGEKWLSFLDAVSDNVDFSNSQAGKVLVSAPYRPSAEYAELQTMARHWIKRHKREAEGG